MNEFTREGGREGGLGRRKRKGEESKSERKREERRRKRSEEVYDRSDHSKKLTKTEKNGMQEKTRTVRNQS